MESIQRGNGFKQIPLFTFWILELKMYKSGQKSDFIFWVLKQFVFICLTSYF